MTWLFGDSSGSGGVVNEGQGVFTAVQEMTIGGNYIIFKEIRAISVMTHPKKSWEFGRKLVDKAASFHFTTPSLETKHVN